MGVRYIQREAEGHQVKSKYKAIWLYTVVVYNSRPRHCISGVSKHAVGVMIIDQNRIE